LTVKTFLIFEKRFTVLKTVNRFLDLNFFILTSTIVRICHRWALEFVGSSNLPPKVPNFGIRLSDSGKTGQNLATTDIVAGFQPVWSESGCILLDSS
jgi:hypothetical protein